MLIGLTDIFANHIKAESEKENMSDIELVVKIPEEVYKDIQSHDWKNGERWYSKEWRAIHNGIILSKGHWIEEINDYGEVTGWHCDNCYEDSGFTTTCKWGFCPNCGAKMDEVKE